METKEYLKVLCDKIYNTKKLDAELYTKYDVKKGLRDISGKGVLAGLTEIAEVHAYVIEDDYLVPCEGQLYYRGYNLYDIIAGFQKGDYYGFEEIIHLLLFGELPSDGELADTRALLDEYRTLPDLFVRDVILKNPSKDMMNMLARSVLNLYSYDENPDDISVENVLRQSLQLIVQLPMLAIYGYHAYMHQYYNKSLYIHAPKPGLSTAENILHMLRPDSKYTELEAKVLDLLLVLHAEHGGGNNSSFTTHVVTSAGTDTYSSVAASLASLKGPRHGGANIKVHNMFEDLKANVDDWKDEAKVEKYLQDILDKKAFDKSGLIYGIGHAVYSLSDPRAVALKKYAERLAIEKGYEDEYKLYAKVEELAPEVIGKQRKMYKGVSANVDFYSGLVYRILGIPIELYTPLFAIARIVGWSAHRIEEIKNAGKIIRPAYKSVSKRRDYLDKSER